MLHEPPPTGPDDPPVARDVNELGAITVATPTPTPPALPAVAVDRLPRGELGIPDLDEDPFWRLVAAFLVECRRPQTRRAYFTDLKAWYAWCTGRELHPLQARRHDVALWARQLAELAGPKGDVVAARLQRMQLAFDAPGVPGLQIGEVRAARLRPAAFDEKSGDQAPEWVLIELGDPELAARQPIDRVSRQRRRRRDTQDIELVDVGKCRREPGRGGVGRHLPRSSSREDNVLYPRAGDPRL